MFSKLSSIIVYGFKFILQPDTDQSGRLNIAGCREIVNELMMSTLAETHTRLYYNKALHEKQVTRAGRSMLYQQTPVTPIMVPVMTAKEICPNRRCFGRYHSYFRWWDHKIACIPYHLSKIQYRKPTCNPGAFNCRSCHLPSSYTDLNFVFSGWVCQYWFSSMVWSSCVDMCGCVPVSWITGGPSPTQMNFNSSICR